jgi:hypothetical protein
MKKLLEFHNAWLPMIIFNICLVSLFMYGFTIKALINLIVLIYCIVIIICTAEYQKVLETREKSYKKIIRRLLDEKTQSSDIH